MLLTIIAFILLLIITSLSYSLVRGYYEEEIDEIKEDIKEEFRFIRPVLQPLNFIGKIISRVLLPFCLIAAIIYFWMKEDWMNVLIFVLLFFFGWWLEPNRRSILKLLLKKKS